MILLFLIACVALFVVGCIVAKKDTHVAAGYYTVKETGILGHVGIGISVLSGIWAIIFVGLFFVYVFELTNTISYDAEIAVIQEQNTFLEEKISACVLAYLEHEGKTYDTLTPDKALAYATALPELSSNVLVQEQIGVYKENRDSLQELLIKKARVSALRYKVYFGK